MRDSMLVAATLLCAPLAGSHPAMADSGSGSLSEIFKSVDDPVVVVHMGFRGVFHHA